MIYRSQVRNLKKTLQAPFHKARQIKMIDRFKYQMVIQWSEEDHCFLVGFPDFPGQQWRTHGETYEDAVTQGIEALESLVIAYETSGDPLPEPNMVCAA
jgi:predicted RNase H-like HicB family nuclease